MSKEQMRQEKLYQATMSMVRKMLAEGLITEEEYRQIDTMFLAKYRPLFGTLFSEHILLYRKNQMPILRSELYAQQADRPWRYGVLELWQQEEKEERNRLSCGRHHQPQKHG